jgi:hypothetical protein
MVAFKVIVVSVFVIDCGDTLKPYLTQSKAFSNDWNQHFVGYFFQNG